MGNNYYREELNKDISMGEVALLCYETILDKDIMSRIVSSTILNLHLKGYIEFKNNAEITLKESNEKLKKSEKLILDCLKKSDMEKDGSLMLYEITRYDNLEFSKNKVKIKDFIIEDAIGSGYIDKQKLKRKQQALNISIFSIIITILAVIFSFSSIKLFNLILRNSSIFCRYNF